MARVISARRRSGASPWLHGRSRNVEIGYKSEDGLDAYWGLWINTGGWSAHHHFAVEPTTGRFGWS